MSIDILLKIITRWQVLLVSGLLILFLPLVSYIASIKTRSRRRGFIPPAERALHQPTD
jgi:hypothetical protein